MRVIYFIPSRLPIPLRVIFAHSSTGVYNPDVRTVGSCMFSLTLTSFSVALSVFVTVSGAAAKFHGNHLRPPALPQVAVKEGPVISRNGTELPPYNTTYYFDQLIDHTNPSLGTFQQRFWFTSEYYEPGEHPSTNTI